MVRHRASAGLLILAFFLLSAGAARAFSIGKEIKLGEDVSKQVEEEMPLSKNEKWQQEIADMGQRFLPYIKRKQIPYHFRIVEAEDELNAFALPGGYVYFTERMWRIMTPDERAAIMAHEIAHCDQRHGVDSMIKAQQRMLWTLPLVIATGGGAAGYAISLGNVLITQRYSRKMEREADELGIELCKKAGYNPAGAVTSMLKLLHIESSQNRYEISSVFASHPDTQKRVDYLKQAAIDLGADRSELTLKAVSDPSRLGNVTKTARDVGLIYAETSIAVRYGQKLHIKKMLWKEDVGAVAPKTVAVATVLLPGKFPVLVVENDKNYTSQDVMEGDGIYPSPTS